MTQCSCHLCKLPAFSLPIPGAFRRCSLIPSSFNQSGHLFSGFSCQTCYCNCCCWLRWLRCLFWLFCAVLCCDVKCDVEFLYSWHALRDVWCLTCDVTCRDDKLRMIINSLLHRFHLSSHFFPFCPTSRIPCFLTLGVLLGFPKLRELCVSLSVYLTLLRFLSTNLSFSLGRYSLRNVLRNTRPWLLHYFLLYSVYKVDTTSRTPGVPKDYRTFQIRP